MKQEEFKFDPKAATTTLCAALQDDRACLAMRIVDESEDIRERKFYCRHYHVQLESKQTALRRRAVTICKRCEQCREEHPTGVQPDFDADKVHKFLEDWQ